MMVTMMATGFWWLTKVLDEENTWSDWVAWLQKLLNDEKTMREITSTHRLVVARGTTVVVPGWDEAFLDREIVLSKHTMHVRAVREGDVRVLVFTEGLKHKMD